MSERMKGQGNQGNNNGSSNLQYPFSVKVGQWSNNHAGSNSSSVSYNQKDRSFNNHRADGNNGNYNAWGGSQQVNSNQYHSRGGKQGHNYDDYNSYSKGGGGYDGGVRDIERGISSLNRPFNDRNASSGTNSHSNSRQQDQAQKDAARKMTWASIASQPPKPTVSTTSSLGIKKKPGMPPPPMVPGRHNMDIGTWDSPAKSGAPLVPPPIIQAAPPKTDFPAANDSHANGSRANGQNPAWPTPDQAVEAASQQVQQQNQQNQQQNQYSGRENATRDTNRDNYRGGNNDDRQRERYQNSGGYAQRGEGRYNNHQPSSHHANNHSSMNQNYQNNARYPRYDDYSSQNYNSAQESRPPMTRAAPPASSQQNSAAATDAAPVTLDTLLDMSKYNPAHFEIENIEVARFFVIKSYSEDDIHRSIKYNIWCSTEHGNKRLDQAFHEREKEGGAVYLFYSVNGSGHFCGMAQMISSVDYSSNSSVWAQNKWKGSFKVRWIYVKDVPNPQLRAIRLENNENKPVTNSRDTQEVPNAKGEQVWRIIHSYKHSTSLFDDFVHYEQRQREEDSRRVDGGPGSSGARTPPPPHQYRSGGYQESNNNPRDSFNGSGGRNYNNDRGNSGFDRNYHGNGGGYENKSAGGGYNRNNYGYRRDENSDRDREGGYSSGGYSRGGYRNNRGGFNNDYYNRRQEGRERGGGYRPQYNSVDPENE
ncbi:YTH domain-containing family protein isoform X2 [Culicoides brevitarsis]|uniref:YTH domain-containing family protein isoform X2 n=1 Tax=Culicoides brevitarsis TaxID=469753 RepID=UPI00307B1B78